MAINEEMALKEGLKVLREYAWFDFVDDEIKIEQLNTIRLHPDSELVKDYFIIRLEKPWVIKPNIMGAIVIKVDPDTGFAVYLGDTIDIRPSFYLLKPDIDNADKYNFANMSNFK